MKKKSISLSLPLLITEWFGWGRGPIRNVGLLLNPLYSLLKDPDMPWKNNDNSISWSLPLLITEWMGWIRGRIRNVGLLLNISQ